MMKRNVAILLAIFAVIAVSTTVVFAGGDRKPGIHFALPINDPGVTFPASFQEEVPAIFGAYKQVMDIPNQEAKIRTSTEKQIKTLKAGKLNSKKRKKIRKLQKQLDEKIVAFAQTKKELRNAFLFLAEDYLIEKDDPYILLLSGLQFYEIRGEPPVFRGRHKAKASQKVMRLDDDSPVDPSLGKTVEPKKAELKPAEPVKAAPAIEGEEGEDGEPKRVIKEYKNHYDRIIDYCQRIIELYPDFEYMAETQYLLGVTFNEAGKPMDAMNTFAAFEKDYKGHKLYPEVLFRHGELMFDTNRVFDHFDQAYELYSSAVKSTKSLNVWHVRGMYKQGWSAFLSMNFTEESEPHFRALYNLLAKEAEESLNKEQKSIKAESKHMLIMFKRGKGGGYEFFQ